MRAVEQSRWRTEQRLRRWLHSPGGIDSLNCRAGGPRRTDRPARRLARSHPPRPQLRQGVAAARLRAPQRRVPLPAVSGANAGVERGHGPRPDRRRPPQPRSYRRPDAETGEGIGVARYVRHANRPDTAEVAVTVLDDWHRRGLGTLLLEVTGARARKDGITNFSGLMLASNREMMDVFESLGPVRIVDRELSTVEIEMPIPEVGVSPGLRKLLRVAARHDVAVPLAGRDGMPRPALRA